MEQLKECILNLPILTNLLKRRGQHRLRRIMRGYRFLKRANSLDRINNLKQTLTTQPLVLGEECFSKYIFGAGVEHAEIICRQYLLVRVAGLKLNNALLHSQGKAGSPVVYGIPRAWRKILRKKGFNVSTFRTAFLWQAFVAMLLLYGFFRITSIIYKSVCAVCRPLDQPAGRYVYFEGLVPGALPQIGRDGRSHDIVTWYKQWGGRVPEIETLCHGIVGADQKVVGGTPVASIPGPIPALRHGGSIVRFMIWGVGASLIATWDCLRGRWWHALLLNQAALAAQVRMQTPELLAKEYLFHNSGWIYRPLWTYEALRRGSKISFYYYSTNVEPFKLSSEYPQPYYGCHVMNWPRYLVWDRWQADFIHRVAGEQADVCAVGPIWFQSSAKELPTFSGSSLAVFDVTPHRSFRYQTLGLDFEYFVPDTCVPFLSDIHRVAKDIGFRMLWKRKRNIGRIAHPRYRFFAEQLSACDDVVVVDPDISAYRVIEASSVVISMPFTSTALIARELGKPSCYYDPTGLIHRDDRAAHGIEILRNPEELLSWLKAIPFESTLVAGVTQVSESRVL